jgi:hypothetical protein
MTRELADIFEGLLADLSLLAAFEPATVAPAAQTSALELGDALIDAARSSHPNTTAGQVELEALQAAVDDLTNETEGFCDDRAEAALGVPFDRLCDANGIFLGTRLLGAYHGDYAALGERLRRLLRPVTGDPPDLHNAIRPAESLALIGRPLLALRAAVAVKALFEDSIRSDRSSIDSMREVKLDVDKTRASHHGMIRVNASLEGEKDEAARAYLILDLYRRVVEGQLRPSARGLLGLCGRKGPARELANLREQLLAEAVPILDEFADAILPIARNASAHEDYWWDPDDQTIVIGQERVTPAELEDATDRAYALMAGCECGWACARATSPHLAATLDAADPPDGLWPIEELRALDHFGTNGLLVTARERRGNAWVVTVEGLPHDKINPCLQALVWAGQILRSIERFQVRVADRDEVPIDVPRRALEANWLVWQHARETMTSMPQSAFLPTNAWARMAIEPPGEASESIAWLALNDAVDAIDQSEAPDHPAGRTLDAMTVRGRAAALAMRLDVIVTALGATLTVFPEADCDPLERAFAHIQRALEWAKLVARGGPVGALPEHLQLVRALHTRGPIPAALPTIDPTPLDQVA